MISDRHTISEVRVRYAETDQMGIVYHTHYLVWCEVGRTDYIRALGTTYAEIEREGIVLAVADVRIRYVAPARYDDRIRIRTWLERVQSRAVTFGYELTRANGEDGARIATATIKLIALDASGSPCLLPASLVRRFHEDTPAPHH